MLVLGCRATGNRKHVLWDYTKAPGVGSHVVDRRSVVVGRKHVQVGCTRTRSAVDGWHVLARGVRRQAVHALENEARHRVPAQRTHGE